MPSEYDKNDQEVIRSIAQQLINRQIMNINNDEDFYIPTDHYTDNIFPEVNISYEEMKSLTGRDKLRHSTAKSLASQFDPRDFNTNVDEDTKQIQVSIKTIKQKNVTNFTSFSALQDINRKTINTFESETEHYKANEAEDDEDGDYKPKDPLRDPFL